ncbi:Stk1 family PASTA domain-containing Ser/Thr kinase [Lysinibacter sp. HNR]|uniref:Stk1 family PASTA domain-containing Ser/Thr kinase n=1 Tax=Lysinibacter sp. HNR TaxID=3031408 RepID=UPI002435563C|nr:Stk1 family PASTA domain-containing Ser/Thr kinase [Lysinibacter sp. HNR]WGD37360.1 Stk1 family PASTA domain-containing Ser/Thr kinase [Lysinibacter sp. HNR]
MINARRILAGRYEVGELIGTGGMSTVFRGTDTKLGRPVAIKILKAALANDTAFRERFRQEAQSASRMAHPTIVRIFDAGEDLMQTPEGSEVMLPFIVMEYVEGQNLREIISSGPLGVEESCRIIESVLTALEYSHRAGVVHRDIKPANIMITPSGQIKVMDFGIARAISDSSSTVAQTTAILGTAAYFSPEQAKGETVDTRTDLYSAGIVLYEMLTGAVPFNGDTAVSVAYQHVSEPPLPPSTRNSAVPESLDRVVMRALAKDRTQRFQTATEFREYVKLSSSGSVPDFHAANDLEESIFGTSADQLSESELALKQLAENTSVVRTQNRPPVMWMWTAILSIGVIIVAVTFWLLTITPREIIPDSTRIVPNLSGQTQEQATEALNELELLAQPVTEESDTVEAGKVIRTEPDAETRVSPRDVIRLYVSSGKATASVPDTSRMTLEQATQTLETAGFRVGTINRVDDPVIPTDNLISTDPEIGATATVGTVIRLTISTGSVSIPDVTGQGITAARDLLNNLRLTVELSAKRDCSQETGSPVVAQSLVGQQPQSSRITIFYCSG